MLDISSVVIITIPMSLLIFAMYSRWKHDQEFGNIESNRSLLRDIGGHENLEVKLAYDSLVTLQGHPNSFRIISVSSKGVDTTISGYEETVYFITFHYKKSGQNTELKAKFAVFQRKPYLMMFDVPLKSADYARRDSVRQEMKNTFEDAMKYTPDSLRKILEKEFRFESR